MSDETSRRVPPLAPRSGVLDAAVLACLGAGPMRPSEVAARVGRTAGAVSGAIRRLCRRGQAVEVDGGSYRGTGVEAADPLASHRDILRFLQEPRRMHEIVDRLQAPRGTVKARVEGLVCIGAVVRRSRGVYLAAAGGAAPSPPSPAPAGAPRPVRLDAPSWETPSGPPDAGIVCLAGRDPGSAA